MRNFLFVLICIAAVSCSEPRQKHMANISEASDTVFVDERCIIISPYYNVDLNDSASQASFADMKKEADRLFKYCLQDSIRVYVTAASVVKYVDAKQELPLEVVDMRSLNKRVLFFLPGEKSLAYDSWSDEAILADVRKNAQVEIKEPAKTSEDIRNEAKEHNEKMLRLKEYETAKDALRQDSIGEAGEKFESLK